MKIPKIWENSQEVVECKRTFGAKLIKKTWYTKMNHRESRVNFAEEKQEVNYETGIVEVFK